MGRSIAPRRLEFDEDASVGPEAHAVLGERGAEERAAELFEAGPIVGGAQTLAWRSKPSSWAWRAPGGDVTEVRLVAEAADAGAGAGAEGDAALDGGADDPGQDGRGLAEGVGRRAVVFWLELATGEQPPDPGADGGEELRQVLIARWGRGVNGEVAGLRLAEDAVEHERVVVEVELEAAGRGAGRGASARPGRIGRGPGSARRVVSRPGAAAARPVSPGRTPRVTCRGGAP